MRMVFGPDDEEAYFQARSELMQGLLGWAAANGRLVDPFVAEVALDYKWQYADGRLDRWTAADLTDFLLIWAPRKATMDSEAIAATVPTMESLLDYLAGKGLLLGGDRLARLRAALYELRAGFAEAMRDPARFGRPSRSRPPCAPAGST